MLVATVCSPTGYPSQLKALPLFSTNKFCAWEDSYQLVTKVVRRRRSFGRRRDQYLGWNAWIAF